LPIAVAKKHLAESLSLGADRIGLLEDVTGLARGVEHGLVLRQHHAARTLDAGRRGAHRCCVRPRRLLAP